MSLFSAKKFTTLLIFLLTFSFVAWPCLACSQKAKAQVSLSSSQSQQPCHSQPKKLCHKNKTENNCHKDQSCSCFKKQKDQNIEQNKNLEKISFISFYLNSVSHFTNTSQNYSSLENQRAPPLLHQRTLDFLAIKQSFLI